MMNTERRAQKVSQFLHWVPDAIRTFKWILPRYNLIYESEVQGVLQLDIGLSIKSMLLKP